MDANVCSERINDRTRVPLTISVHEMLAASPVPRPSTTLEHLWRVTEFYLNYMQSASVPSYYFSISVNFILRNLPTQFEMHHQIYNAMGERTDTFEDCNYIYTCIAIPLSDRNCFHLRIAC